MVLLLNGNPIALQKNFIGNLVNEAIQESPLASLAKYSPMPITGGELRYYTGGIESGPVPEGGRASVSEPTFRTGTVPAQKLSTIVLASKELVKADPHAQLAAIETDLRASIGRAVTLGVLHGKSTRAGASFGAGVTYVNQTTSRVDLPAPGVDETGPKETSRVVQAAYQLARNGSQFSTPNGIIFDDSIRGDVLPLSQVTAFGQAAEIPNLTQDRVSVMGLNSVFARGVDGRLGAANVDLKTRAFVGDWQRGVHMGYGEEIRLDTSNESTVVMDDGSVVSLFQNDLVAYKVTSWFAWAVFSEFFAAIKEQGD